MARDTLKGPATALGFDAVPARDPQAARKGPERRDAKARPDQSAESALRDVAHGRSDLVQVPHRSTTLVPRLEQRLTVVGGAKAAAAPAKARVSAADPRAVELPPLPAGDKPAERSFYIGFLACVVFPVLIAAVYFGLMASNQYVAEFRFTVKDAAPAANATGTMLSAILGSSGGTAFDNYIVTDFLTSREAADELEKRIKVTSLYARPEADWWSRFNRGQPMEKFVHYWQKMITARYDQVTGIATAEVRAFTPQDAYLIANTLVELSEELVNRIANRTQTDAVKFAQREVDRAEQRLKAIRAKMTEYRNRTGVIDPNSSVVASNSALIQTLRANLAQMETQLATLTRQDLQPNSPVIVTLQNQIKSTKEQLENTESMVGRPAAGGSTGLSTVMAEYEQLDMERQFAQSMLTSTMQALDQARASAASQHLYITPYVRPSVPQSAAYPRRLMSIFMTGLVAFGLWLIGLFIARSIRERFA